MKQPSCFIQQGVLVRTQVTVVEFHKYLLLTDFDRFHVVCICRKTEVRLGGFYPGRGRTLARWPVGSSLACIRGFPLRARLGFSVAPFPTSATSHAACGFTALRAPAQFAARVMRPIKMGRLPKMTADARLGTHRRVPRSHTAIPCSTASIRSPGAERPGGSTGSNVRSRSSSPSRAEWD